MAALRPFHRQQEFGTTHWTTIRACAGDDDAAYAARARLCQEYWYPLYAYIKRLGNDSHYAEDLTQEFFAYILKRPWFVRVDQSKGRFRSFLLASLDNFLKDQFDRRNARKRGGGYQHIPPGLVEEQVGSASGSGLSTTPAQLYEVEWASAIVAATLKELEEAYAAEGRQTQFQHLKYYLTQEGDLALYRATAAELGITVQNVTVLVHRLRKHYGLLLKQRVAMTVAAPEDVEGEIHHLRSVLALS